MRWHSPSRFRAIAGLVLGGFLLSAGYLVAQQGSEQSVSVDERLLGELDLKDEIWIGQGAALIAWPARLGKKSHAVIANGERGPAYERVGHIVLSPDGRHLAYTALKQKQWLVVADGQEGKAYQEVARPAFSPDGKHIGYTAKLGQKRWRFVLDGQEVGVELSGPSRSVAFSNDGGHWAFWYRRATLAEAYEMLVDGELRPHWAEVVATERGYMGMAIRTAFLGEEPGFSPDGKRLAYVASTATEKGTKLVMVLDGEESGPYDGAWAPTFSPDGSRFAFVVGREGKVRMVVDGTEGPQFDSMSAPVFSADGSRLAYVGVNKREAGLIKGSEAGGCVVVDGQPGPMYQGGRLGVSLLLQTLPPYWHHREKELNLNPERSGVSSPVFSSDGRHVAYTARRESGDIALVVDGEIRRTGQMIADPRFLPDGRLTYAAVENGKWRIILGDAPYSVAFDDVGDLHVSEDGRHHAFLAWQNNTMHLVLDQVPGKTYDNVYEISVSNDGVARFVGRRGRSVYLVEQGTGGEPRGPETQKRE